MALRLLMAVAAVIHLFNPLSAIASDSPGLACYDFTDALVLHVRLGRYGPPTSKWRDPYTRDRYLMEMFGGTNYRCFQIPTGCGSGTQILQTNPARVNGEVVEDYAKVRIDCRGLTHMSAWTPIANVQ